MLSIFTIALTTVAFQETAVVEERNWRTPTELVESINSLAQTHPEVTSSIIGASRNGQPIHVIRVARSGDVAIEDRSAVLLVAGIDGDHLHGSEVAVDVIEELLSRDSETTASLFESHALYVIPQVNPDAALHYFDSSLHAWQHNLRPVDNDHDGFVDEDDVDDLNGDGKITMMRVFDKEKATHIPDPDDSRLDSKPTPFESGAATYVLYSEGLDDDGDGKYNEDGIGGVDINKNFMHGYQIHGDGAGPWQLSEPESKALITYVLDHQEIAAVLVYGHHDTLSKPWGENGRDKAGAPKQLAEGDVELYSKMSETFVEITKLKGTSQPNWDGSFVAWAYAQYGVPAFSTPLWSRPEPAKEETPNGDDAKEVSSQQNEVDEPSPPSMRGNFDRQAMMDEFDTDGDGELSDSEREKFRDSMQERFGDRRGGGQRGQRGGSRRGGPPHGEEASVDDSSSDSDLTPSGVGDISQETLDELLAAAKAAGYPVTDEMMADISPEDVEQYAKMSGVKIRRIKSEKGGKSSPKGDAAWLAYSDESRGGEGFVAWEPFDHPQLGAVEIGGWVPYFKTLPPTSELVNITKTQADVLIDITSKLPQVSLDQPSVKNLGKGLWEVKVSVVNDGWLPSGTAMSKRNKRARPYVLRLNIPNLDIVTGQKIQRIWALTGNGNRSWFKWIIKGDSNAPFSITLYSEKFGSSTIESTLKETDGGDA